MCAPVISEQRSLSRGGGKPPPYTDICNIANVTNYDFQTFRQMEDVFMSTSANVTMTVSLTVLAGLLFMTDRVARQFTVPKESKHYRIRQSMLALGFTAAGALIATAVRKGIESRGKENA